MKKLMIVFSLIFAVAAIQAQDVSFSLSENGTNIYYAGVAGDTILNTDTWTYSVDLASKPAVQLYSLQMKMDSLDGTPEHTINTYGTFDGTTLVVLDTVSWKGTSADTTFQIYDASTGVLYRKFYIRVTGSSTSKSKVNYIWGKFVNKY